MDNIFRFADDLSPAKIIHIYEPEADLKAIVVVDNVACGPAIGGVRMAVDVTRIDVKQLIKFKNSGKSVIDYPQGDKLGRDAVIDIECDI